MAKHRFSRCKTISKGNGDFKQESGLLVWFQSKTITSWNHVSIYGLSLVSSIATEREPIIFSTFLHSARM